MQLVNNVIKGVFKVRVQTHKSTTYLNSYLINIQLLYNLLNMTDRL
jgi:hypothetical protein